MNVVRRRAAGISGLVATAALAALLLLVVGSTLLSVLIGKGNDVFVSVVSNALYVPLGAALTLLYFNGGRDRILAYRYRRRAARSPQDLLPGATGDSVRIERSNLINEVLTETAESPAGVLHVVTGPSGSGKTTLLQSLIRASAAEGFIPVVVQADLGADFANMESCLQDSFIAAADRILRVPLDLTRAWRTIRTSNRLLIFVDGLDDWRARMGTGAADTLALLQQAARATPYRYLAAMRSGDENLAYTYPTYAVGTLELDAGVLDKLLPAQPFPVDRRARESWLTAIEATEASRSPLFMKLAVELVHHRGALESIPRSGPVLARSALLDGWLDRRLRRHAAYHPESQVDLEDEVMMLARIAFCLTVEGRLEAHLDEIPAILDRHGKLAAPPRWRRITRCVQLGQSLDLLRGFTTQGEDNRRLQFRHSTFQAHLAVLFLRRYADRYRDHDLQAASEELIGTLCAYVTETPAGAATRAICRQGIRALKRGDGGDLAWITVLISAPRLTAHQRRLLLGRIDHHFAAAADSEKVRIVALVAGAAPLGDNRYRLLWDWSRQGGYAIGISAVRALARGGSVSLREVGNEVDRLITASHGTWLYDAATWRASGEVVTTLSTAVPLWREHVDPGDRHVVERWNRAILDLVAAGQLGGVEVSVITGFEVAARQSPSADIWTNVVELLHTVRSHDAKLRLLRLFYLHGEVAPYAKRQVIDGFLAEAQHPFVGCYAGLVRTAPDNDPALLWQGNEHSEPKAGVRLHPAVHQLLADRYLLSSLEDQGGGTDEEVNRRQQAWLSRRLPWCLAHSVDRDEIFSGCPAQCDFNLCPLDLDSLVLRRASPASPAFLERAERLTRRHRRPWSEAFYGARSASFWTRLEAAMRIVAGTSRYEDWRQPFPGARATASDEPPITPTR